MIRELNPFVVGKPVPPTHFIGRESVINNCYNRLAGPVRTSIAISGEHGMGKTSLLHYLIHIAEIEDWGQPYTHNIMVYLDCQTVEQFTPTRFWHHVLELLKQTEYGFTLHERIDRLLSQPEIDPTHIQNLLRWLNQQGLALVLLLDSFSSLVKSNSTEANPITLVNFLSGLRALANLPNYALTMLTATRDPLNILCADIVKNYPGSHFFNNFAFEALTPFTLDEIDSLFKQAMSGMSFEFDQADGNLLNRMAGAHPALLQMASFHLLEARRHGPLTPESYKKVIEDFERAARHYFSLFWDESSPLERTLFILIILLDLSKQSSLPLDMTGEEIQRLLQRHERDLMRLVERGLVQYIEDSYQIFSAIFIWWIVCEVTHESETELADRQKTISDDPLRRAWQELKKLAPHLTLDRLTQTLINRGQSATSPVSQPEPKSRTEKSDGPLSWPQNPSVAIPPRYELRKEVGRGANGIVYKAFDNHLTRTVAIKLLNSPLATPSVDSRHRLLKEARMASQLQHPHIVTIYDVTEVNDHICLVMEYLKGQTLANLLQEEQRLPLKQVIALVEQAASALDYAHAHSVIHRDIKPANLMITSTGGLKLADFGIAKVLSDPQTIQSTGVKGTVIYMSPEQVNQQPLDGRSDLFSLATVAFEMLSGAPPWPGTSYFDLMKNITHDPPLSLFDFNIPAADMLEPIFQKALTKNPGGRYQCGQDFVQALKTAITR